MKKTKNKKNYKDHDIMYLKGTQVFLIYADMPSILVLDHNYMLRLMTFKTIIMNWQNVFCCRILDIKIPIIEKFFILW